MGEMYIFVLESGRVETGRVRFILDGGDVHIPTREREGRDR